MSVRNPKAAKDLTSDMNGRVDDALEHIKLAGEALDSRPREEDDPPADKKDMYDDGAVMVYVEPKPYGGAKSFAEVQDALKAQKTQTAVSDLAYVFRCVVENILAEDEQVLTLADKAQAVVDASKELATLLGSPLQAVTKVGLAQTKIEDKRPILERLKDWVGLGGKEDGYGSAFWSFKDEKGEWRWLSAYSNNFKDRDGEIFTAAAHKEFVQAADKLQRYPELWVWHTPGSRIGFCDFLDVSDGFIVASGKYDDPDVTGPKLAAKADELGVSHGYRYPVEAKENGVIHRYFDFEISVLPQRRASNPHMPLDNVLKEGSKMTFEKRHELVDVLGEAKVTALEAALGDKKEELMAQDIDWKSVKEALAEPATPAPAAPATPAPATPATPATPEAVATPATAATPATPEAKADPDPKPDDEELAGRVGKIEETLGVLTEATKEIVTSIKELRRSKDEIIAEEMSPRRPAPLSPEQRPSQSESTVISDEKAAKLREELGLDDKEQQPVNPASKYVAALIGQ